MNRLMSNVQFVLMKDWKLQGILFSNCVWLKKKTRARNERRQKILSGSIIYVYMIKTFVALAFVIQIFESASIVTYGFSIRILFSFYNFFNSLGLLPACLPTLMGVLFSKRMDIIAKYIVWLGPVTLNYTLLAWWKSFYLDWPLRRSSQGPL